jgi:heat shock protein HslJ
MAQASAYLQALGEATTYQINGQQLVLFDANGKELVTFTAQSQDLSGTSWLVISYNNGKQAVVSVAAGTELTANFGADGMLSGSAGCNNYSASYQTDGDKISIGRRPNRKACEQAVMDQEQQYLAALATASTYRIDGSKLELRTADGALAATFQQAAAGSDALPDSSWIVTGYNNGKQAVVSTMAGTDLTANFGADGLLSGSAGCNNYSASYQTDGDKIAIGPAVSTKKACTSPEGVMDQEAQYLAALATAATYRIDGSKLELRTAEGALAATFQQAMP